MRNKGIGIKFGILVFMSIFTIMLSCNRKDGSKQVETEQIVFEELVANESIGSPAEMQCMGKHIYISDHYGDSIIKVISLDSGKTLHSLAAVGNGPGEMKRPISFFLKPDSILVYSRPLMTLFSEYLDGSKSKKLFMLPWESSNVFAMPNGDYIVSVMPFGSKENSEREYRFMLLDSIGNIKSRFGTFPRLWEKEKDLSVGILGNFHQTNSIVMNDDDSLVVFSSYVISVYERNGETYSLVDERVIAPYQYEYSDETATRSATARIKDGFGGGVWCAFKYKNKIIAARRYNDSEDNKGLYFDIYDNKGKLERTLIPDVNIYPPAAITDTGKIIAFGKETEEKRSIMVSQPIEI